MFIVISLCRRASRMIKTLFVLDIIQTDADLNYNTPWPRIKHLHLWLIALFRITTPASVMPTWNYIAQNNCYISDAWRARLSVFNILHSWFSIIAEWLTELTLFSELYRIGEQSLTYSVAICLRNITVIRELKSLTAPCWILNQWRTKRTGVRLR